MIDPARLLDALIVLFGPRDLVALAVLLAVSAAMTLAIERPPRRRPSTASLMERHRRAWIEQIAARDTRIMDAQLLSALRAGAAFFASTCLIAIGGTAALLGQVDRLASVVTDLGGAEAIAEPVWEAKLLVLLVLLVNAFLKFVWAHRLFGYVAVLIGAMPPHDGEGLGAAVDRTDILNRAAARAFNRGLRHLYFTLAALAWFLGPEALMLATLATALMLVRREFFSASRRALLAA